MGESIITMSLAGLLAGFLFSMPIAGPISILITTNALKGRLRYCNLVNIGASFADFIYVFIAVFGLTKLYSFYKPIIPYIFSFGSLLLIYLGYKIYRTKIDIEHLEDKTHIIEKIKKREKGAFYTGFMINFFNPTLFIGWLTSSLLVISFIAALGLHTGGLAVKIDQNAKEISNIEGKKIESSQGLAFKKLDNIPILKNKDHHVDQTIFPASFHLLISICYAFFISVGSIIWFYLLAHMIVRFRKRINIKIISAFVKSLGIILCFIGLYFGFQAVRMFISLKI
jgi:threonine/homoserine/homoserine lactone efflux protein